MKEHRGTYIKTLGTAGAVVLIVVLLSTFVGPNAPYTSWFRHLFLPFHEGEANARPAALAEIIQLAPATLELILVSFAVAAVVGVAFVALSARMPRSMVATVMVALQSIPFFWLILVLQFVLAVNVPWLPTDAVTAKDGFDVLDRLRHLILPAGALALFQLPPIVEYLQRRCIATADNNASLRSVPAGLAVLFSERLPEVIAATLITEGFVAWPGVGRAFFDAIGQGDAAVFAGLLLVSALFVVVVRFGAEVFASRETQDGSAKNA
jgi:peptide/nickel transport system permease protein